MQGSNPSSALFSAQRPQFETGMACSSLTKRTSWSNGSFTSVPCSTGPQKWLMKHSSPFSSAPWSQNLMPHLTQQRLMQPSNSCKQARLRDQMEYQPRCLKPVVKPLSLTLPGCSKCSGSMASSHGTSGMPTSSTCTKTRVIAHPVTTTAGSASSALQARYWPVSCWTGSRSTYWMMLCLRGQRGFRKPRGMVDMVFAIRQLQAKCVEQHQDLHLLLIDLTKAFDHCEPSCTLGDTQQAWMPTSISTDHPLLPWWHVLQGHRK